MKKTLFGCGLAFVASTLLVGCGGSSTTPDGRAIKAKPAAADGEKIQSPDQAASDSLKQDEGAGAKRK